MSEEALKIISDVMESLGLLYGFMEYKVGKDEEAPEIYFVGEYQELEPVSEDGLQESTFILTGFSRSTRKALEEAKAKIKKKFHPIDGLIVTTPSGNVVAIFYSNGLGIPTGDAELKRIQINLDVKEWSVN